MVTGPWGLHPREKASWVYMQQTLGADFISRVLVIVPISKCLKPDNSTSIEPSEG